MIIRGFRHVGDPRPLVASDIHVLLLEDENGTPLFVACEYEPGAHVLCTAQDPDFNRVLRNLGIDKITICDHIGDGSRNLEDLRRMPLILPKGKS